MKQETESNPLVYYEKDGESYTDVIYTSKTFDSVQLNYTKVLNQNCLVGLPSTETNTFDIKDFDCNKKSYAICQMFSNPNRFLTVTPPLPSIPIFQKKTELPNFNCYLPRENNTHLSGVSSKRRKRQNEENAVPNSIETNGTDNGTHKLVLLLDPDKESERERNFQDERAKFTSQFGDLDLAVSYPYLFELLWYSQLPCSDVKMLTSGYKDEKSFLKKCYWDEQEIECHSIFHMRTTDRGMCCSFNSDGLENTLKEGSFSKIAKKLQVQDSQLSFDSKYTNSNQLNGNGTLYGKAGHGRGLTVFLDAHTEQISSGTVFDDFSGFSTVVDGSDQFPMTFQKRFLIQPGYENSVALSAVEVISEHDIRSIPAKERRCYFSDEHPLNLHKIYSQSNCLLECSLEYTNDIMKRNNHSKGDCKPWFYPVIEIKMGFCDPWQTKEYLQIMSEIPIGTCDFCLPDCATTIYDSSISTAPIRYCDHTNLGTSKICSVDPSTSNTNPSILSEPIKNEYWKNKHGTLPDFVQPSIEKLPSKRVHVTSEFKKQNLVFKENLQKHPDYDAFHKDIALVNFYFEQSYAQKYKRQHRLKPQDFIAQVGGLFGLAIGLSLVSIFEIFWHFVILPLVDIAKKD